MTTSAPTASRPLEGTERSRRILAVTRLHFANRWTMFGTPWLILAIIFAVNVVIWWTILTAVPTDADRADVREGMAYSGAAMFIFIYMLVVAVQSISITFGVALGFGSTRRNFYLGTCLAFLVVSVLYSVGFTILAAIEEATGGWGLGGRFFTTMYFAADGWPGRLLVVLALFLFFIFTGAAVAAMFVRWRSAGVVGFFAVLALALIAAVFLITTAGAWPAVGAWFVRTGATGLAAWSLLPTAVACLAGYLLLRRAAPVAR